MPARIKVEKGERYGRLSIIKEVKKRKGRRYFLCECDCGTKKEIDLSKLRSGNTKSCGCLNSELAIKRNSTHGMSKTRIYHIWAGIKDRIFNKKATSYEYYGGRGIEVCSEWMEFEPFHEWAISNGYKENLTLERIDVNGNYCPENCTWITQKEQCYNTRSNLIINYKGEKKPLKEWTKDLTLDYLVVYKRLKRGWPVDKAFTLSLGTNYLR